MLRQDTLPRVRRPRTAAWAYLQVETINVVRSNLPNPPPGTTPWQTLEPPHATTSRSAPGTSRAWTPRVMCHPHKRAVARRSRQQPASVRHLHHTSQRTGTQHLAAASSPHSHGQPPRARPHPVPPWERRPAHRRFRARAAKTFSDRRKAPFGKLKAHPRFAFTPCTLACPQAQSAPQGAPRGRAQTRGGRQPWERASTRGRTRQSART